MANILQQVWSYNVRCEENYLRTEGQWKVLVLPLLNLQVLCSEFVVVCVLCLYLCLACCVVCCMYVCVRVHALINDTRKYNFKQQKFTAAVKEFRNMWGQAT